MIRGGLGGGEWVVLSGAAVLKNSPQKLRKRGWRRGKWKRFVVPLLGGVGGSITTWNMGIGCGLITSVTLLKKSQVTCPIGERFGMS